MSEEEIKEITNETFSKIDPLLIKTLRNVQTVIEVAVHTAVSGNYSTLTEVEKADLTKDIAKDIFINSIAKVVVKAASLTSNSKTGKRKAVDEIYHEAKKISRLKDGKTG